MDHDLPLRVRITRLRLTLVLMVTAAWAVALLAGAEVQLGKCFLVWGCLLLLLWPPSLSDRRSRLVSEHLEGIGVMLVALGTIMSIGLPHGPWAAAASTGAILMIAAWHGWQGRRTAMPDPEHDAGP